MGETIRDGSSLLLLLLLLLLHGCNFSSSAVRFQLTRFQLTVCSVFSFFLFRFCFSLQVSACFGRFSSPLNRPIILQSSAMQSLKCQPSFNVQFAFKLVLNSHNCHYSHSCSVLIFLLTISACKSRLLPLLTDISPLHSSTMLPLIY